MVSRRFLLSLLLLTTGAAAASAQPSDPAGAALTTAARVGDHVIVVNTGGREIRGIVRAVSEASITVNRRVLDAQDVHAIRQTDSLANGTWTGLAVGLGVSVASLVRCGRYEYAEQHGLCVAAGLGSALLTLPIGGFLGRDIDRARGDREVYRRRQGMTPTAHLAWTRRGPAVGMSMTW